MTLSDQTLSALLFYSENSLPQERDRYPDIRLAHDLGLIKEREEPDEHRYRGRLLQEIDVSVRGTMAHDTFIAQLCLALPGEGNEARWEQLKHAQDNVLDDFLKDETNAVPWAISMLCFAAVPANSGRSQLMTLHQALVSTCGEPRIVAEPDSTPYGWLWRVAEDTRAFRHGKETWCRDLLLLIPNDRAAKVLTLFVEPLQQGFSRIELYLQKCKHHARQHEIVRLQLSQAMKTLQQEMVKHLGAMDLGQPNEKPQRMERIAWYLMRFLAQKAAFEILLNSLRNNCMAYNEHLASVKLETQIYELEGERILRQIAQMESDLHNASVIQASTYAFQDLQRSAEAGRFERASYLLGGTAAFLAGISLFGSFLEIWSLAIENSGWVVPAGWLRLVLSLIASVSIPVAVACVFGRKKIPAIIAILVSLVAIAAMVFGTFLINR
jgi:hypothetical protein